jgi:hypothetical protein
MLRLVRNIGAVALAAALTGCIAEDGTVGYSIGVGYGGPGYGFGYGYSDYYDPYYDGYGYGTFYGSLMFGGSFYDGPHRYRRGRYGREYWMGDRWRRPDRDGQGEWRDDPPTQGAGNDPPPRPNAGFFRERNAAAARAERTNDAPGRPNTFTRNGGDGGNAREAAPRPQATPRAAVPRPGAGQAAARARAAARAGDNVE